MSINNIDKTIACLYLVVSSLPCAVYIFLLISNYIKALLFDKTKWPTTIGIAIAATVIILSQLPILYGAVDILWLPQHEENWLDRMLAYYTEYHVDEF